MGSVRPRPAGSLPRGHVRESPEWVSPLQALLMPGITPPLCCPPQSPSDDRGSLPRPGRASLLRPWVLLDAVPPPQWFVFADPASATIIFRPAFPFPTQAAQGEPGRGFGAPRRPEAPGLCRWGGRAGGGEGGPGPTSELIQRSSLYFSTPWWTFIPCLY